MYEKQLPRTEHGLLSHFEVHQYQIGEENIKKCLEIAEKLKKKGWTESWFYRAVIEPYVKKHSSNKMEVRSDI